jgi:hypothetical protein
MRDSLHISQLMTSPDGRRLSRIFLFDPNWTITMGVQKGQNYEHTHN